MREAIISFPMFGEGFQLNPPAYFSIGSFRIYFYGIIIALGLMLAILYGARFCKRVGMTMDVIYDYLIWAIIAGVVCARLYYCVTYVNDAGEHTYLQNPLSFFSIRDGGMAIYGSVIGAILALAIVAHRRKETLWKPLDMMSFGFLIGQCIGRWGNFFNREAFGYATDVFCRMGLTPTTADGVATLRYEGFSDAAIGQTVYVHPTFLYESLWNLLGLILMHLHCRRRRHYQGQYFLMYLMWYGFGRFFIEGLRTDSLWLVPGVIRVSQLLAALTCAAAAVCYILNARRLAAGKKPFAGRLDADDIIEETETQDPVPAAEGTSETEEEASALPAEDAPPDEAEQ